jgi:hypothetical protein
MKNAIIIFTLILSSSCSLVQKTSIKIMSGALKKSANEMQKEADWDYFKDAVPGNLMLMESLLVTDPENENLLSSIIQGFVGYGFGVYETLWMDENYREVDHSIYKPKAIAYYTKAHNYGQRYLEANGITRAGLMSKIRDDKALKKYLNDNLDEDDFVGVFFTAQAWGSLMNLQRTNMKLMGELGLVKSLFDFVCEKDPSFSYGACDVFYGSYELSRPKFLGGNPEKGKKILRDLMKKQPENLLAQVTYLQLATIPSSNEDEFSFYERRLHKKFMHFSEQLNAGKTIYKENDFAKQPYLNLFNAIAMKRFYIMRKNKKELF